MAKKKTVINEKKGVGTKAKKAIVLSLANEAYAIMDIARIVNMSMTWVQRVLQDNGIHRRQERIQTFSGQSAMNEMMKTGNGKEVKITNQTTVECGGKVSILSTMTKRRVLEK